MNFAGFFYHSFPFSICNTKVNVLYFHKIAQPLNLIYGQSKKISDINNRR